MTGEHPILTNEQMDHLIREALTQKYQATDFGGNDPNQYLLRSIAATNLVIVELLQRLLEVKIQELDTGRGDDP